MNMAWNAIKPLGLHISILSDSIAISVQQQEQFSPYDVVPSMRPIVLLGPSLKGYEVWNVPSCWLASVVSWDLMGNFSFTCFSRLLTWCRRPCMIIWNTSFQEGEELPHLFLMLAITMFYIRQKLALNGSLLQQTWH